MGGVDGIAYSLNDWIGPPSWLVNAIWNPNPQAARRYGPTVGEPPLVVDPRRWGSLIGLLGAMVFIGSYSSVLGPVAQTMAWIVGLTGLVAALFFLYVRPVPLGLLVRPRPLAMATYFACVVGELALIAIGSRLLDGAGLGELRPALVAAVVGVHFIPFAWAFHERMFLYLGGAVAVIGAVGLMTGALGVPHAADAAAVVAGVAMLAIITLYARGRFAP